MPNKPLIDDSVWTVFLKVAVAHPEDPDIRLTLEVYRWLVEQTLLITMPASH
jgi:hypothetical protein